jgi:hypothetical protein
MDTAIIGMYCLVDDWLRARRHQESVQRTLVDAEIITIALTVARFFDGNFRAAQTMLLEQRYLTDSLSQYNRHLHRVQSLLESLFDWLGRLHKTASRENVFLIDSCPIPVCDNIRIRDCRIYPSEATEDVFRGYHSSKRRWFYGLKVHLIVTAEGYPVEASLTPGSVNDTKHLRSFEIDLPEGSVLYGDKAYNEYFTEDLLAEACSIELCPQRKKNSRKKNSTRGVSAPVRYLQQVYRKRIETTFSQIEQMLPKSIHAVTARGFELKVFLFVLAFSISGLV